ncbi:MAG TPA: hypothetical protein VGI10_22690 [Polyangiaceae bacterium]|jgi:hypothetical protein
MWNVGAGWKLGEAAGNAGTVTLPKGAVLILIIAHASAGGATLQALGGPTIPVPVSTAPLVIQNHHALRQQNSATGVSVIFTGTDSYYVQYATPGNL